MKHSVGHHDDKVITVIIYIYFIWCIIFEQEGEREREREGGGKREREGERESERERERERLRGSLKALTNAGPVLESDSTDCKDMSFTKQTARGGSVL